MSTELVKENDLRALESLSNEQLQEQLSEIIGLTIANIKKMATIISILEGRGVDLTELHIGLGGYLRLVAAGTLSAEALVRFADRPLLLRTIASLPVESQRELANGKRIKLAVFRDDKVDHRLIDPLDLTAEQIGIVFGKSIIRTPEQQVAMIEQIRTKERRVTGGGLRPDKSRKGIIFGRKYFPAGEVLAALCELSPGDADDLSEGEARFSIRVTEKVQAHLKVLAAESGCSVSDLIKRALRATGTI